MLPEIRRPEAVSPVTETPKESAGLCGGWPTVGLGAAIFAMYFVTQTLVAVPFLISQFIASSGVSSPQSILKLASNGNLISTATIASAIVGVGFIILFIKMRKGACLRDYLALKPITKKTFLVLLLLVIGHVMLASVLDQVVHAPQDTGFTIAL